MKPKPETCECGHSPEQHWNPKNSKPESIVQLLGTCCMENCSCQSFTPKGKEIPCKKGYGEHDFSVVNTNRNNIVTCVNCGIEKGKCINCQHKAVCYEDELHITTNKEDAYEHVTAAFVANQESKECHHRRSNGDACPCIKPFFELAQANTETKKR